MICSRAILVIAILLVFFGAGCASKKCNSSNPQANYQLDYQECENFAYMRAAQLGGAGGVNPITAGYLIADCMGKKGWQSCE